MKKRVTIVIQFLMLLLMMLALFYSEIVTYGIAQGIGQCKILWEAKPIVEIQQSNAYSDSLKNQLKLVDAIKQFAEDSLGINRSNNYTTFYQEPQAPILYTVTACKRYAFEAREWQFPIIGKVSYKGFFSKEKAKLEVQLLKKENYDVAVFSPEAWSTLGWFKDPVMSGMLKRSKGQLANTIIHELTHGTIFIKDNVQFNENLASFIGDKGAELFLTNQYGNNSLELKNYQQQKADQKLYKNYVLLYKAKLDSLYHSFRLNSNDNLKDQQKRIIINEFVSGASKLALNNPSNYFNYSLTVFFEGNAFFMSYERYESEQTTFETLLEKDFNHDLRKFLAYYKAIYSKT